MERRQGYYETLLASVTKTAAATGNSQATPVKIKDPVSCITFVLDVSAAATLVGDTLNVYVQTMLDGVNWCDVVAFTQVLGNGGVKRYIAKLSATAACTMFENATTLTAGNQRDLIGDGWAIRWALVGTGSFTFSVTALPG